MGKRRCRGADAIIMQNEDEMLRRQKLYGALGYLDLSYRIKVRQCARKIRWASWELVFALLICVSRGGISCLLAIWGADSRDDPPPSIGGYRCLRNARWATAETPSEKGCVEYDLGLTRRSAHVGKQEGVGFQRSMSPNDSSPSYFNLSGDISIITMCGYFLPRVALSSSKSLFSFRVPRS